jgi:hypothetical protein
LQTPLHSADPQTGGFRRIRTVFPKVRCFPDAVIQCARLPREFGAGTARIKKE